MFILWQMWIKYNAQMHRFINNLKFIVVISEKNILKCIQCLTGSKKISFVLFCFVLFFVLFWIVFFFNIQSKLIRFKPIYNNFKICFKFKL